LTHPLWWSALLLLVLNDHVFKGSGVIPSVLTGKLSDFAGMIVAPVVLCALFRIRSRPGTIVAYAAVGILFSALNTIPALADAFTHWLALIGIPFRIWSDPSDLVALPALAIAYALFGSRPSTAPAWWIPKVNTAVAAIACVASSPWPSVSPATVAQNQVLMEHHAGVVFVLDAPSGTMVRSFRASITDRLPPAIHDRILYQVQPQGRITGIHIDNPQEPFEVWKHPEQSARIRIRAVDAFRLYVAGPEDRLYAIDRVFGSLRWTLPIDTCRLQDLTITDDTLIVTDGPRCRSVDARTGRVLWEYLAPNTVGAATIHREHVYIASSDGILWGLDVSSGRQRWRYDGGADACDSYHPSVFAQDNSVFACFDGQTRAISVQDRSVTWKQQGQPVAIAPSLLLLQSSNDTLHGVLTTTGKIAWTTRFDESVSARPVIWQSLAFVRDDEGRLFALDLRSGTKRWNFLWPDDATSSASGTSLVVTTP
jgi:outer membrane protein assembly factor BamB